LESTKTTKFAFFLAHDAAHADWARRLYHALRPLPCALDQVTVGLGRQWQLSLVEAQAGSRVTVVLVTRLAKRAFYLHEEIARAIDLRRREEHEVVPVFIEGQPRRSQDVPNGLYSLQGIDGQKLGIDGVASHLKKFFQGLRETPPQAGLAPGVDELTLQERAILLPPRALERVIKALGAPGHHFDRTDHSARAQHLVLWATGGSGAGLRRLDKQIALASSASGGLVSQWSGRDQPARETTDDAATRAFMETGNYRIDPKVVEPVFERLHTSPTSGRGGKRRFAVIWLAVTYALCVRHGRTPFYFPAAHRLRPDLLYRERRITAELRNDGCWREVGLGIAVVVGGRVGEEDLARIDEVRAALFPCMGKGLTRKGWRDNEGSLGRLGTPWVGDYEGQWQLPWIVVPPKPAHRLAFDQPIERPTPPSSASEARGPLARYLRSRRDVLETLPPLFLQRGPLTELYVELSLREPSENPGRRPRPHTLMKEDPGISEFEAFLHHRGSRRGLVVLGNQGSGKTTFVRRQAIRLIDEHAESGGDGKGFLVPIVVEVPELREAGSLADLLLRTSDEPVVEALRAEISAGRAVFFLDGLDQEADGKAAKQAVERLTGMAEQCKVVLTSRPVGYERPSEIFRELELVPLDSVGSRTLLQKWLPEERVTSLLADLELRPRLATLLEVPLLVSLVGMLTSDDGRRLPEQRSELYLRLVNELLLVSYRCGDPSLAKGLVRNRKALRIVALHMQKNGAVSCTVENLVEALEREMKDQGFNEGWLGELSRDTGLLVPLPTPYSPERYTFAHQSLREFLAAEAIQKKLAEARSTEVDQDIEELLVSARRGDEESASGAEVLAFTCGLLSRNNSRRRVEGLIDLVVREREAHGGNFDLLYQLIAEADGLDADLVFRAFDLQADQGSWSRRRDLVLQLPRLVPQPSLAVALLEKFAAVTTHGADRWFVSGQLDDIRNDNWTEPVPNPVRQQAERAARSIWDDPRGHRSEALDALRWTTIRGGRFWMGTEIRITEGFEMLTVPVSHAVYELFDPGHRLCRRVGESDDHPVHSVTWYEAVAFAKWLGGGIRLPTEIEWEYGCRAGTSGDYWWDRDRHQEHLAACRYGISALDIPRAVGGGRSNPWGLFDLLGNVWEWTGDEWAIPSRDVGSPHLYSPSLPPDCRINKAHRRVLRGGSFASNADQIRCASRFAAPAGTRAVDVGIRLVRIGG